MGLGGRHAAFRKWEAASVAREWGISLEEESGESGRRYWEGSLCHAKELGPYSIGQPPGFLNRGRS